jgi:hypothetical protein
MQGIICASCLKLTRWQTLADMRRPPFVGIFSSLYFLHPVVHHVLKVYLTAVNTTADYKTDIKVFDIRFIYMPLHVSISEIIIRRPTNTYLSLLNYLLK